MSLNSYDVIGIREDLSDVVSAILLSDTNLLSRIGISGEATSTKHEWLESALNPATITDAEVGGLDAAGTNLDLTITSGQNVRCRVGTLLRDTTRGKTEVLQVTTSAAALLTVTRGYGATSPEIHATGTVWRIIAQPKQEGEDASTGVETVRVRKYNYLEIFERAVSVSGTTQAVVKAGVPDEFSEQTQERLMELMVELDAAMVAGVISAAGSSTVYRTMDGIIQFLTQSGANSNSTAEEISYDAINQMCSDIEDDGGTPNVIACNQTQIRKISKFDLDKIRVVPGAGASGRFVTQILTDLGYVLDIVKDRNIPSDTAMVLDSTRIKVVPLINRAFGVKTISVTGDAIKGQIIGEYTLEVKNATQAHAIHTNLAV